MNAKMVQRCVPHIHPAGTREVPMNVSVTGNTRRLSSATR